jgi:acid stress-induced BolA-like protein IbaG/YrbA
VGIAELAEKVKSILEHGFEPAEIGLSTRNSIVAWVISEHFESMDDLERQEAVWNLLDKSLSPEERRAVAIVVALTPKEREFHKAGSL